MIFEMLFSIFGCLMMLTGIILLTALSCLVIRDLIDNLKR